MSNDKTVHEITDAPALEGAKHDKIKKTASIAIAAVGTLVLLDTAYKRFSTRKSVKVIVEDKPSDD